MYQTKPAHELKPGDTLVVQVTCEVEVVAVEAFDTGLRVSYSDVKPQGRLHQDYGSDYPVVVKATAEMLG